jgi:glycosyltransferase involved in cell wall biosynthesis
MDEPLFSILIPTRDRAALAEGCIRTILGQRHDSYEVLVLDQSEGHATRQAVERAASGSGRVRYLRIASAGRSRALNAGIPLARGKWLVITDDDCEAAPGWLAALEDEVGRARGREAIVGRVLPGPVEPGKAVPPATIDDPEPTDFAGRIDRDLIYPNFAIPRSAFAELGEFDERMGVGTRLPGGEDNDFGYRLLRAGWRILYRPAPTVIHRAWRSEKARAALKRSYGIGQGAFYAKHLAAADPFIAYRFARDVLRTTRAAAGAALRGWPRECRGHLSFLAGLFVGAVKMAALMMLPAEPEGRR